MWVLSDKLNVVNGITNRRITFSLVNVMYIIYRRNAVNYLLPGLLKPLDFTKRSSQRTSKLLGMTNT
jgi:hypothetical protein